MVDNFCEVKIGKIETTEIRCLWSNLFHNLISMESKSAKLKLLKLDVYGQTYLTYLRLTN